MQKKIVFTWFFFYLFAMGIITVSAAAATTYTVDELAPKITAFGNLTKDVKNFNDIFAYVDNNNENQTLSYARNGNLTFEVWNIKFKEAFLNKSVVDATETTLKATADVFLLQDANEIPYILIDVKNNSAISAGDYYYVIYSFSVDVTLTKEYYVLFEYRNLSLTDDVTSIVAELDLELVDEGGENHWLLLNFKTGASEKIETLDYATAGIDDDTYADDVKITYPITYQIVQLKIQTINEILDVSCVKIKTFQLALVATSDGSASQSEAKGQFRVANIYDKQVKINNLTLNKTTTIAIDSDTISSTVEIEKISDVVIPFKFSVDPQVYGNPKVHKIEFDYRFQLPDDSELSFSSVKVNLTLPSFKEFSVSNVTEFYINTEDKLTMLQDHEAGDEITIMSSVSVGYLNRITLKIKYKPEYYNIIMKTGAGFFWFITRPIDAIYVILGSIIAIICGALGFKKLKEKGEEVKSKGMPKQKKGLKTV